MKRHHPIKTIFKPIMPLLEAIAEHLAEVFTPVAVDFLRGLIWIYRHTLSSVMGRHCRFMPTCSAYADTAIHMHGPIRGSKMAIRRFCRCHPWGGSGFDPVPGDDL